MNYSSYFIKNKALFGAYPSQDSIYELEKNDVKYFINLTCNDEKKITPYNTTQKYIHYPINDHKVPKNWRSFAKLIITISNIINSLENNDKIYIHCKAGISRSGMVVSCILCYMYNISPDNALELTSNYFKDRLIIKDKLRKLSCPQNKFQINFVKKFFKPIYFYKVYKYSNTSGFSNFSLHPVKIENFGNFPTAEAAFQAYKDPYNNDYISKQVNAKNPRISKKLGKMCNIVENWESIKDSIAEKILLLKFDQNKDIKENLINTGLRVIVSNDKNDSYWGIGPDNIGKNIHGKILMKIRDQYYLDEVE